MQKEYNIQIIVSSIVQLLWNKIQMYINWATLSNQTFLQGLVDFDHTYRLLDFNKEHPHTNLDIRRTFSFCDITINSKVSHSLTHSHTYIHYMTVKVMIYIGTHNAFSSLIILYRILYTIAVSSTTSENSSSHLKLTNFKPQVNKEKRKFPS